MMNRSVPRLKKKSVEASDVEEAGKGSSSTQSSATGSASSDLASSDASNKKTKGFSLDIAKQAVSKIVSRSVITVDALQISQITAQGFQIDLHLRISNTGPAKAKVSFPQGLSLYLSSQDEQSIATIQMPPLKISSSARRNGIDVQANVVANAPGSGPGLERLILKLVAEPNQAKLYVLTREAHVKAYGMSFKRITLEKTIVLQGMRNLGGVLHLHDSVSDSSISTDRSSISNFRIIQGDPEQGILFTAQVELHNPSTITAVFGDIHLQLATDIDELRNGSTDKNAVVGIVTLPALLLRPGSNLLHARGNVVVADVDHSARAAGVTLIRYLLENRAIPLKITGTPDTSDVPWVTAFFRDVSVLAELPKFGMSSKLLDGASLISSEDSDVLNPGHQLFARATIRNELGPLLRISSLQVDAIQDTEGCNDGHAAVRLGQILTESDWPGLQVSNDEPVHANLPFQLSADGPALVLLLRHEAEKKGIHLNQDLVQALDHFPSPDGRRTSVPSRSGNGLNTSDSAKEPLDLPHLLASALSSLKVSAHITTCVGLGNYRIPGQITFVQHQLPIAITIKTARAILPVVGAPLLEALMDQAVITMSRFKILDLDEKGLSIEAEIALTDFGPLDVEIYPDHGFDIRSVKPLSDMEHDTVIARIVLSEPLRGISGNEQPIKYRLRIHPTIGSKSVANFATFVAELIDSDSMELQVSTDTCRIVAGGAEFMAPISKTLHLPGFGGLKGLEIDDLDILDEVPAPMGPGRGRALSSASSSSSNGSAVAVKEMAFHIRTRVRIPHSGRIAVALSKIEVGVEFQGIQIGVVTGEDIVFALSSHLVEFDVHGYILVGRESLQEHQSLQEYRLGALETFGKLASQLLAGLPIDLTIKGYRAFAMGEGGSALLSGRTSLTSRLLNRTSIPSTQFAATRSNRSSSISNSNSSSGSGSHGSSTTPQKQVPWLDQAFRKFSTTTVLQQDRKPVIDELEVHRLHVSFNQGKLQAKIDEISTRVQIPFRLTYTVLAIKAQIEVHYDGYGCVGTGSIDESSTYSLSEAPSPALESSPSSNQGKQVSTAKQLRIQPKSFELMTDKEAVGLAQMISHVADCETTEKISVRGKASARVETALGEFWVDVDLGDHNHVLRMDGLRGLRSSPVQYTNLQVVDASPSLLKIVFTLYLNNPSKSLEMDMNDLLITMGAYYRGSYVGRAHIPRGFVMTKGPVAIHDIYFEYCPPLAQEEKVRDVPANFLSGRNTLLEIRGDDQSCDVPMLLPALKNIRLSFELRPMMDRTLIDSISITLGVSALTASAVEAVFVVNNPLGVSFDLCAMSFMASYQDKPFGSCTVRFEADQPLRIPPGTPKQPGQQKSAGVTVTLAQPLEKTVGAFIKSKGTILLDLDVTARVEIQGFQIPVFNYLQPQLPLHIKGLEGISKWMKFLP